VLAFHPIRAFCLVFINGMVDTWGEVLTRP